MKAWISSTAIYIESLTSRPESLAAAFFVFGIWIIYASVDHFGTMSMNAGSNISGWVPFVMVFALNYTAARNAIAIHAKLDIIILSLKKADNRYIGIEKKADEEVEALHSEVCNP